jgi:intraflagellar transport protein 122
MDDPVVDEADEMLQADDPFTALASQSSGLLRADRNMLRSMHKDEVFVFKWPSPGIRNQYYRQMIPDVQVSVCPSCNHLFHEEDFEFAVLRERTCPFCRSEVPSYSPV